MTTSNGNDGNSSKFDKLGQLSLQDMPPLRLVELEPRKQKYYQVEVRNKSTNRLLYLTSLVKANQPYCKISLNREANAFMIGYLLGKREEVTTKPETAFSIKFITTYK